MTVSTTARGLPRPARVAAVVVPLAFLAVFFVYPVLAIVGRGLAPHWSVDLDPLRCSHHGRGAAPHRVVHGVAGDAVDGVDPRGRDPGRLRAGALRVPGTTAGARAGDGSVRAADGRGGLGVRRVAGRRWAAREPRSRPDPRRDPDRPRVLQLLGGGAHCRQPLVPPRPPTGRGSTHVGRQPRAHLPRGDAACVAARDRGPRVRWCSSSPSPRSA